jgi:hypothetical protein
METFDAEVYAHATGFIDRSVQADTAFFAWFNTTRMPVWTRLKPDGMVKHDTMVGNLLTKLDRSASPTTRS